VTSAVLGDGGVYSSIEDLAKWDAALYDTRLAFTPATPTDDPAVRYGFGWRITGETLWHSGQTVGFRNVIIRYPRRHFTVIVLTNRDAPEPYALALAIAKLYVPEADAERAAGSATGPDPRAAAAAASALSLRQHDAAGGRTRRRQRYPPVRRDQSSAFTTSELCTPRTPSVSRAICTARSTASFEWALPLRYTTPSASVSTRMRPRLVM
jgi:CubicO group peptidase (beta-lactamase class C family)